MIELIKIKNYALIQDSEIDLTSGLNVITGETGAGKSLFLSALSLILGEKVSKNIIGSNGDEATVEVILKNSPSIWKKINSLDLDINKESSLIIKRVFGEKNRCYINGELITQSQLRQIMKGAIDICSQHENQSITEKENQLSLLDEYAEISLDKLEELYQEYKRLSAEKTSLLKERTAQEEKKDYMEFVLGEIKKLNPTEEDLKLEDKLLEAKNIQKIVEAEQSVSELFNGDEGVRNKLKAIYIELKSIDEYKNDTKSQEYKALMDQILAFDIKSSSRDNMEDLDYILERSEALKKLTRKHGGSISSLIETMEKLEKDLDNVNNFDSNLEKIEEDIKKVLSSYMKEAKIVSKKRKEASFKLAKDIESSLKDLNMANAKFMIELSEKEPSINGIDDINYMISANKGEELDLISEIASGGELSRILLSIYNVSGEKGKIYLFDEVDAGIGGDTGTKIGQKLREMSKDSQIICITHLPQVAVFADSNFKIDKKENSKKTVSNIWKLNTVETEQEISRMLGSSLNSSTALSHAREMLKKAKS